MPDKKINLTICSQCGLCADICPLYIFEMNSESGYPGIIAEKDRLCTACGHCEAVCPVNAIEISSPLLQRADIPLLRHPIDPELIRSYFAGRRSIRKYKNDAVPRAQLDKLLDIARYASSAVNRQPVKWVVVQTREKVAQTAAMVIDWGRRMVQENSPIASRLHFTNLVASWENGKDPICRKSPHLVIAYSHKDDMTSIADATIALAHLELAAPSLGLGACWAGYVNVAMSQSPALRAELGIPEDCLNRGSMMLGYPAYSYARIPKKNKAEISWI